METRVNSSCMTLASHFCVPILTSGEAATPQLLRLPDRFVSLQSCSVLFPSTACFLSTLHSQGAEAQSEASGN